MGGAGDDLPAVRSAGHDDVGSGRFLQRPQHHIHSRSSVDQAPSGDIVFVSTRDGNPEIYSVRADGSNVTRLTNHPANDDAPVWSPDRKRIAFASDRDGSPEIYVMNADGTNVVRRTFSGSYSGNPCWSPDGTRIVYSRLSNGSANIWAVSPDSGPETLLVQQIGYEDHPALSPDGTRLAIMSDWWAFDFVWDIFIANGRMEAGRARSSSRLRPRLG